MHQCSKSGRVISKSSHRLRVRSPEEMLPKAYSVDSKQTDDDNRRDFYNTSIQTEMTARSTTYKKQ